MKRKSFSYVTTKVYGGKPGDKTVGIHFDKSEKSEVIKFARSILQAIEYGKGVDITAFTYKKLKNGKTSITVTAPI